MAMSNDRAAQSGEDRLIARYFAPLAKHPGAFGLADDAAALAPPAGCDLVLKADGIVAGVHFFPDDPPDTVAKKALRANLSDLAAKGATPLGFLLTLALPREIGDAALGLLLRNDMAAAERWSLGREASNNLQQRYLVPQPRLAIAEILRAHASAAMDVSDGLAGDLAKLCRASAVNADIEVARVPLSAGARAALAKEPALIETIITGGDDYEVLACVPADKIETLRQQASAAGVPISEIGVVAAGEGGARFLGSDGEPLAFSRKSFSHF